MVNENGLIILDLWDPPCSRHKVTVMLERVAEHKVKDICARYISRFSRVSRLHCLCRHDVCVCVLFHLYCVLFFEAFCVAEVTWLTGVMAQCGAINGGDSCGVELLKSW